jgi:hypothetical protein
MMNGTRLAFALLLLLLPVASAAQPNKDALATYYYAWYAYGWRGGAYPFESTTDLRYRGPLRTDGLCWAYDLRWVPCR